MSNPTLPWYIVRIDGEPYESTQDAPRARAYAQQHVENMLKLDHLERADARERVRIETVPPEWPAPDFCGRTEPHEPHTWGGKGYGPYECHGAQ